MSTAEIGHPGLAPASDGAGGRRWVRHWAIFVALAIALYLALYGWSEYLVYAYGEKNRFFMIKTAPQTEFDYVILGASHAMPFGFDDNNEKLEEATGARIINLSTEGAGIMPNRLMLDYFLRHHTTRRLVYILDSFAFYSPQWNEDRLVDAGLFKRAPLDPALVASLWEYPWARPILPDYVSGFSKINNADRFERDLPEMEGKFDRTYKPIAQIDRQRIKYLYPADVDPAVIEKYMSAFEDLITFAQAHGIEVLVMKPPMPPRLKDNLPNEAAFDAQVTAMLQRHDVPFYDYTGVVTEDPNYLDTDHLNRTGVTAFDAGYFVPLLKEHMADPAPGAPAPATPAPAAAQ